MSNKPKAKAIRVKAIVFEILDNGDHCLYPTYVMDNNTIKRPTLVNQTVAYMSDNQRAKYELEMIELKKEMDKQKTESISSTDKKPRKKG